MDKDALFASILKQLEQLDQQLQALNTRVSRLENLLIVPASEVKPKHRPTTAPIHPISPLVQYERPTQLSPPPMPSAALINRTAPQTDTKTAVQPVALPQPFSHAQSKEEGTSWDSEKRKPEEGFDWRGLLERFSLLPPSRGESLEVQVGTWWITRIGTLLAVIGVVFFGIYISQGTPPWVKLLELALVSAGFAGLGLWLERRYEKYGATIFGGGLALIYFTTFAAYALPAVKVINSANIAAMLQLAAVFVIIICALWRNSSLIAVMAISLGYVTCLFSFNAGLNNFALAAALGLGLGAIYFYCLRQWPLPFELAVLFTYAVYGLIFFLNWLAKKYIPAFEICHAWLIAYLLVYGGADLLAMWRGTLMTQRKRVQVQILNSTAAVALGFLVTWMLFHDRLASYYFTYGGVLTSGSALYYFMAQPGGLMQSYFVKGSLLLTMGIITHYEARTRWIALGAESLALLFSARRSRLRIIEAAMTLVWIASLGFFLHDTWERDYLPHPATLWSTHGLASLGYLFFSAYFLCLQARWLSPEIGTDKAVLLQEITTREGLYTLYAILLGILGAAVGRAYLPTNYLALGLGLIALGIAVFALIGRHWIPYLAAAIPFLYGHARFWFYQLGKVPHEMTGDILWISGITLALLTLGAALALVWATRSKQAAENSPRREWLIGEGLLHALWMITLQTLYAKTFEIDQYFFAVATAWIAAILSGILPLRMLADLSALPLGLAWAGHLISGGRFAWSNHNNEIYLWLSTFGAFAFAGMYAARADLHDKLLFLKRNNVYQWLHTFLAILFWVYALLNSALFRPAGGIYPQEWIMPAFALAALVVGALARWPGLRPALYLAVIDLLLAQIFFYSRVDRLSLQEDVSFLWASMAAAGLTLAYALLIRVFAPELRREARHIFHWPLGTLTLLMLLFLFATRRGELQNYATVFWGIAATVVFLAGLLDRSKPLRLIGLAGFILCIPRVFLVDVHSMLYRIVAFIVLGVVMLIVGFLYTKYRLFIDLHDEAEEKQTQ